MAATGITAAAARERAWGVGGVGAAANSTAAAASRARPGRAAPLLHHCCCTSMSVQAAGRLM